MRLSRLLATFVCCFALAGCPPTVEPPPFEGSETDVAPPADAAPDMELVEDDAGPDAKAPDMGERSECIDHDDDGRVEGEDCDGELPGGDCAPMDDARFPGAPERCNLLDDNCNGQTDEDDPEGGDDCETGEEGVCARGLTGCNDRGEVECERIERPQLTDDCDGLDEDCDGSTDEDAADQGRCDTGADGVCSEGVSRCVNGGFDCVGTVESSAEVCNALDDDCDGETDEDNPGGGGACETELLGLCRNGVETCTGGHVVCAQQVDPVEEVCNGLDDNCDGETDEAFAVLGEECRVGVGACARDSVFVCNEAGNGVVCDASAGNGADELCNGVDDDCDEIVDEGFGLGEVCEVGVGACLRPGVTICNDAEDGAVCDAEPGDATDELCNDLDDNCDGETDEGFPVGDDCIDDSALCDAPGVFVCSDDGESVDCDAPPVMPGDEVCNGLDDDCDDQTDEDFPTLGEACEDGVGECLRDGNVVCDEDDGGVRCSETAGDPTAELCNGLDDNCDGRVDDRAPCAGPLAGRVRSWQIAAADDARCGANALGALAGDFNALLAASVDGGARAMLLRIPGFPDAVEAVELVEADGDEAVAGALDAFGAARESVRGVDYEGGELETDAPSGVVQLVSPFFYDRAAPDWTQIALANPSLSGPVAADGDGLSTDGVVLSGAIDRDAVAAAYRAASEACAGGLDVPGCAVFDAVDADAFEAGLVADLDLDERVGLDSVSACFVLATDAAAPTPALGGQACAADDECFAGLVCRIAPIPTELGNDSSLGVRCGLPGAGGVEDGDPCDADDDCRHGLCARATAAGGVCSSLCERDVDCPEAWSCRGFLANPAGRSGGGRSANVCVPIAGSGDACGYDGDCEDDEVCAPWLEGEVGVVGGNLFARGRCQVRDDDGAQLGFRCNDALDCAHGNGCVLDLDGDLRCASPCDGAEQCENGMVCTDRALVGDVVHGACLPLPLENGSGGDCGGDLDCPVGETCIAGFLAGANAVERYCGRGAGFLAVGQRCAASDDCASGACLDGVCSGYCINHGDCGPRLACEADALVDDDGHVLGGRCAGVEGNCRGLNLECEEVPGCEGGRCVCDQGACRIGCDFEQGIGCPGDLYCEPDDECAVFCRDDPEEPNDVRALATTIDLSRAEPVRDQRRTLCATSGTDWYRVDPGTQPFEVSVTPIDDVPLDLSLFDAAGDLIEVGLAGDDDGQLVVGLEQAPAVSYFVRVRGGVASGRGDYQLRAALAFGDCPDPAPEPRDDPGQWTEVLDTPGEQVETRVDGWVCAQDSDWFAVYVANDQTFAVDVTSQGNGGRAPTDDIEVQLISAVLGAQVAVQAGEGRLEYTPPDLNCDGNALPIPGLGFCRFADGRLTPVLCSDTCPGSSYLIRVAGQTAADVSEYRLDFSLDRDADENCAPDPFEHDDSFIGFNWGAVLLETGATVPFEAANRTLTPDVDVTFRRRSCGRDRVGGESVNTITGFDNVRVAMDPGETLHIQLEQPGPPQRLVLRLHHFAAGWQQLEEDLVFADDNIYDYEAAAGGLYTVSVSRLIRAAQEPYVYDAPYAMTLRRITVAEVAGGTCDDPSQIAFGGNRASANGTTAGHVSVEVPAQCVGATGPERIYLARTPAGDPGTLTATVVSTAEDGYDPSVHIRLNCNAPGTELACNEDDATADDPFEQARASTQLDGGRNVYIFVDSFDDDTAGQFRLRLDWARD